MYLKISPQLSQKLSLSPQIIKSINLLSLSVTELEQVVHQELVENPILEERGNTLEDDTSTLSVSEIEQLEWTQYSHATKNLPEDESFDHISHEQETLREHLMWQIQMGDYSSSEKELLYLLVEEIDDTGYLRETIEDLCQKHKKPFKEMEQALFRIHEMDPVGVGARNLKECLLIQARHLQEDTNDFVQLIENHLKDIQYKRYDQIASSMNLHKDEVMDMVEIIISMEPQPGNLFSNQQIEYVIPDIFVIKKDNRYQAVMNEGRIPRLRIASRYIDFLNRMSSGKDQKTRDYLLQHMKKAIVFIKGLNQRRVNITKLADAIVEDQVEFFDQGENFLKPMLLKEMARKIDVHPSTVSRLINNKFMHTAQGTFKLKYFFGTMYEGQDGKKYSRQNIKEMVKDLVYKEHAPLSDEKMAQIILSSTGVRLERRQVSRIRLELGFGNIMDRMKEKKKKE